MSRHAAAVGIPVLFLALSCGKSVDPKTEPIRTFAGADLKPDQVLIEELRESGDQAIAEVTIRTAVRLRKEAGEWVIDEIRLGDRHWEKAEHILTAIQANRARTTSGQLATIAAAIEGYAAERKGLPEADNFQALIDTLTPRFLTGVIRLDAWSNPFRYHLLAADRFDLRSSGPDGYFDTADDIVSEIHNVEE